MSFHGERYSEGNLFVFPLCISSEYLFLYAYKPKFATGIDDRLPVDSDGRLRCAQTTSRALWAALIEKAVDLAPLFLGLLSEKD